MAWNRGPNYSAQRVNAKPVDYHDELPDIMLKLARVNRRMAEVGERRKSFYGRMKSLAIEGGVSDKQMVCFDSTRMGTLAVQRITYNRAPRVYVPSQTIKRHDPALWAASREMSPRLIVTPSMELADAEIVLPGTSPEFTLPHFNHGMSLHQVAEGYIAMRQPAKALREHKKTLMAYAEMIADEAGWDGTALHFSDGSTFGLSVLKYSSDKLREVDPVTWDDLKVTAPGRVDVQYTVVAVSDDDHATGDEGDDEPFEGD